ncbi:MAG: hypothetical protein J1G38_00700 [Clostridiales bacterium]|nr:hypothetical protein [Clostridiales bacterium]
MRKTGRKIALTSFLVVLLTLACAFFVVACGGDDKPATKKYTVTWELDSKIASVSVEGYEYAETMKIAKGKTVTFEVTPKENYAVGTVKAGGKTITAKSGKYSFTVTEDTTVSVGSKEILDHITVEWAKEKDADGNYKKDEKGNYIEIIKTYYAGDVVETTDIEVKAIYKSGTPEIIDTPIISYKGEEAEALGLGDTEFYVSYPGVDTVTFELGYSVAAMVKLNLNGGTIAQEDLDKLPNAQKDEDGNVYWTFIEPIAAAIELPTPTLTLNGTEMDFVRWSGDAVEEGAIKAGIDTSIVVAALFNVRLVSLSDISFTVEAGVPYLVVEGKYLVSDETYLYMYEGNDQIEFRPDEKVLTVTKDDMNFTMKLNLAEYSKATPVYVGKNEDASVAESFKGKWADIRFCIDNATMTLAQEIILTEDDEFVDLNDQIVAEVDGSYYRFYFQTYTPKAGEAITGGNGAQFTGTEKILKLDFVDTDPYMYTDVLLEKAQIKDDETEMPYLVVEGTYIGVLANEAALQEAVEAIYFDLQNNSDINGTGWNDRLANGEQKVVVSYNDKGNSTFRIYLSLAKTVNGDVVFAHYGAGKANLTKALSSETSITVGTVTYTMKNWGAGWSPNLVCVYVADASAKTATATGADIQVSGEKLLYIITGTYENYTKAELEALYINFDLQHNSNWGRNKFDGGITTVANEAEHTFTVTIDISKIVEGGAAGYIAHLEYGGDAETNPNVNFQPGEEPIKKTVMFGEWKVTLAYNKAGASDAANFYRSAGILVAEAGQPEFTTTKAHLEAGKLEDGETDAAFLVFTGTWDFGDGDAHVFNEAEDLKTLKGHFTAYSVQNPIGYGYLNGAGENGKKANETVFEIYENGTFKVKIALNGAGNDTYWYLNYQYTGRNNGDVYRANQEIDETPVTVNGQTFSFFDSTDAAPDGTPSWLKTRLIVQVTAAAAE